MIKTLSTDLIGAVINRRGGGGTILFNNRGLSKKYKLLNQNSLDHFVITLWLGFITWRGLQDDSTNLNLTEQDHCIIQSYIIVVYKLVHNLRDGLQMESCSLPPGLGSVLLSCRRSRTLSMVEFNRGLGLYCVYIQWKLVCDSYGIYVKRNVFTPPFTPLKPIFNCSSVYPSPTLPSPPPLFFSHPSPFSTLSFTNLSLKFNLYHPFTIFIRLSFLSFLFILYLVFPFSFFPLLSYFRHILSDFLFLLIILA